MALTMCGLPLATVPLFVSALLGVTVPWERILRRLPPAAGADYSGRFGGEFAPLREGFVRATLGERIRPLAVADPATRDPVERLRDTLDDLPVGGGREVSPRPPQEPPIVAFASQSPSISADGSVVAYLSSDPNIAGMDPRPCLMTPPGPTTGSILNKDVYPCTQAVAYDVRSDSTTIASVGYDGEPADAYVNTLMVSGNGRFVVFQTAASNIVPGDTNDSSDIFVRDLVAARTELISVSMYGGPIRRDDDLNPKHLGHPVDQNVPDVLASISAVHGSISHDGRYVVFESSADDLAPGDTSQSMDVFLRDRLRGTTERVSVSWNGDPPPLADVHRDNQERLDRFQYESAYPCMSPNGRYVAFRSLVSNLVRNDSNSGADVFLRDRLTGQTELVSVSSSGEQANNGARPAFGRHYENPAGAALKNCVSNDGRYVVFESRSSNLVENDTNGQWDIFLRDRKQATTRRINLREDGSQYQADSPLYVCTCKTTGPPPYAAEAPSLSPDGGYVAFHTYANITSDDPDMSPTEEYDLFVYEVATGQVRRVQGARDYAGIGQRITGPALSWGANLIAFQANTGETRRLTSAIHVFRLRDS